METWQILLLIAIVLVGFYFYHRKHVVVAPKPTLGMQLVSGAEQIPVYGTAVKAVATVGKPVNHALDKLNNGISVGLQHVPIVGKYLAMPNEALGGGIKKLNSWLGLD